MAPMMKKASKNCNTMLIEVRGFPARVILSLRAMGEGSGIWEVFQCRCRRVVACSKKITVLFLGNKKAPAGKHGASTELVRSEIRLKNSKIHKTCSKILKSYIFGEQKGPCGNARC